MPKRSETTDASVVICAYTMDRLAQTIASVDSALRQRPTAEVVVVVDHNVALLARLRTELPKSVTVVPNAGPRGLSGARNTGIAASSGEVIAFLDDDAEAEPGWLAGLLGPFEDPRVVGSGGHALPVWESGRPGWFPDEFQWVVGCSYAGMTRSGPVRNVLGCSMAFRASLFAEFGGFDTSIGRLGTTPLGCEETELSIRARRHLPGALVVAVEGAEVRHRVAASRGRPTYFLRRCFYEGISKALLRRLSSGEALSSERTYAARVLPAAVARNLVAAARFRQPVDAAGRALASVAGLLAAGIGFVAGSVFFAARPPTPGVAAVQSPSRTPDRALASGAIAARSGEHV